jgi:hypothetical protein
MAEQLITYQIVIATFLVLIALLFSIRHKYSKMRTQTSNLLLLKKAKVDWIKAKRLS